MWVSLKADGSQINRTLGVSTGPSEMLKQWLDPRMLRVKSSLKPIPRVLAAHASSGSYTYTRGVVSQSWLRTFNITLHIAN